MDPPAENELVLRRRLGDMRLYSPDVDERATVGEIGAPLERVGEIVVSAVAKTPDPCS